MPNIDPEFLKAQIATLLATYPELSEDAGLLKDTLEGETEFDAVIGSLVNLRQHTVSMLTGVASRQADIAIRKGRLEKRIERIDDALFAILKATGLPNIPTQEATLSINKGRDRVEIDNVDDLPQGYYTTERVADKKAIMAAIKAG